MTLTDEEIEVCQRVGQDVDCGGGIIGINLGLNFSERGIVKGKLRISGMKIYFKEKKKVYVKSINEIKWLKK